MSRQYSEKYGVDAVCTVAKCMTEQKLNCASVILMQMHQISDVNSEAGPRRAKVLGLRHQLSVKEGNEVLICVTTCLSCP